MSELVIRDLDGHLLDRLHQTAVLHGVSVEDEVKKILDVHLSSPCAKQEALAKARVIRSRTTGRPHTSSVQLKREVYEKAS